MMFIMMCKCFFHAGRVPRRIVMLPHLFFLAQMMYSGPVLLPDLVGLIAQERGTHQAAETGKCVRNIKLFCTILVWHLMLPYRDAEAMDVTSLQSPYPFSSVFWFESTIICFSTYSLISNVHNLFTYTIFTKM